MRAVIFANGELSITADDLFLSGEELIIAADGGSMHCEALDLLPEVLIGDLDSTPEKLLRNWEDEGVTIIHHPSKKDETDLELALLYAQNQGAEIIHVYGAVGGRLDMTFGNLLLLAHPRLKIPTILICGKQEVQLLRSGETLEILGTAGDTISLLSLLPGTSRISTKNLAYSLQNESLEFGKTRGISNHLIKNHASIQLMQGLLAVIHTREGKAKENKHDR